MVIIIIISVSVIIIIIIIINISVVNHRPYRQALKCGNFVNNNNT